MKLANMPISWYRASLMIYFLSFFLVYYLSKTDLQHLCPSAPESVLLYFHIRRISNKLISLCVLFFWQRHAFYRVSLFCFQFFLLVRNSEPIFLSLVRIFASCFWLSLGNMSNNGLVVSCTHTHFWSFVNILVCSIHQKSFVLTNCASKWNTIAICQQLSQYHESYICHHFYIFPWALPVTVTGRPGYVAALTYSVSVRNFFVYLRTVS